MILPSLQRNALFRIMDNETPEFGVIIDNYATGTALIRRGLAEEAPRRSYARATGVCLRLTPAGQEWVAPYRKDARP